MIGEHYIDLKVGDVIRWNGCRKHCKIINEFVYEGEEYFNYIDDGKIPGKYVARKDWVCTAHTYAGWNSYDGVAEVNGKIVRGKGGVVLKSPKDVKRKNVDKTFVNVKKPNIPKQEPSDFQKFRRVQLSGVINMTDIVQGSRLAGISEEKYEDILWHYSEYESGLRK